MESTCILFPTGVKTKGLIQVETSEDIDRVIEYLQTTKEQMIQSAIKPEEDVYITYYCC